MTPKLEWLYGCPACRFERSTLLPGAGRGIDGLETLRRRNFQSIIEELGRIRNPKNLECLEVGCAEGWFIEEIIKTGARISAIEASAQALEVRKKGFDVIHGFFPESLPEGKKYDLIVFNDVFEHLSDPVPAVKKCEEHLNEDGLLLLNMPNRNGFFYRLATVLSKAGIRSPLERLWQKGLPSPHITYFSDTTLQRFVEANTRLKYLKHFYLLSIEKDGLKERIGATYGKQASQLIYLALRGLLPVMKMLPQDIMVFIFTKR